MIQQILKDKFYENTQTFKAKCEKNLKLKQCKMTRVPTKLQQSLTQMDNPTAQNDNILLVLSLGI